MCVLRTLWLEVGVALMYGKQKENRPAGMKFSDWVQGAFPGLDMRDASDAQWFAENSDTVTESCTLSHPRRIREAHNERAATQALPEELRTAEPPVSSTVLPKATAAKVNKLHHRAATGDEGSEIAARMLKAFAKEHGLDADALIRAAAEGDPDGHHRFAPPMQASIDRWRDGVRRDTQAMELGGIPREAIKHLLINLANSL